MATAAWIVAMLGASAATPVFGVPVFPLKASANGRYLVDQNDVGFRVQGDSAWDLLVTITSSDVDTYLANRSAKGFNTLLVELVEHARYAAASPAPANRAGNRPFLSKLGGGAYTGGGDLADLSTPNDAYFAYVDTILAKIAAKNMVALLTPLYVGYGAPTTQSSANEGWSADMNANSAANCYQYGQYVGDRYRNQKNLVWVNGGDAFGLPAAMASCVQQVMQGIKDGKGSGGSAVLQTTQWSREHLSSDDASYPVPLNSVYPSLATVASLCRSAYGRSPVLPAYVIEACYEGGSCAPTRAQLRQEGYRAALSCMGGYLFGNGPLWLFDSGWQAAMDAPGSLDWQRAGSLLDSLGWSSLVPSNLGTLAGTVLVTGGDDIASGGDVAAAASGAALLAYLPSTGTGTRTITVQMGVLGAYARGRWYNPTSGAYTDLTGGAYTLANSGTHAFTTPGNNGTGTNDWVLVLDTSSPVPVSYQGIWWNAPSNSESGWGLNIAHQADTLFASWFTYDVTGRAWWLVMTAARSGPNVYDGILYRTSGPPFNAQPFNPAAVVPVAVGSGRLAFDDASNGTFTYTISGAGPSVTQQKRITREVFGPLPTCVFGAQPDLAAATNYQDLWWAAPAGSESGWGINLNHEGDTIFATWFTYDLDGSPLWLVVTASRTGAATYAGDLYRAAGARFDAFDPAAVVATKVGTASFAFANGNAATFAYSIDGIGPTAVSQTKAITREVFAAPGTVCE